MNRTTTEHLHVCTGSGSLFGALGYDGGPPVHEQRCYDVRCPYRDEPWHGPQTGLPEPPGDFPTRVELCYCCASAIISSGSKFSSFFCAPCGAAVARLRDDLGFPAIPLGRHSLMNGLVTQGGKAADPQRLAAFAAAVGTLFERMDRLCLWQRIVVADRAEAMGPAAVPSVPLPAYLAFAAAHAPDAQAMFRQLTAYFDIGAAR